MPNVKSILGIRRGRGIIIGDLVYSLLPAWNQVSAVWLVGRSTISTKTLPEKDFEEVDNETLARLIALFDGTVIELFPFYRVNEHIIDIPGSSEGRIMCLPEITRNSPEEITATFQFKWKDEQREYRSLPEENCQLLDLSHSISVGQFMTYTEKGILIPMESHKYTGITC